MLRWLFISIIITAATPAFAQEVETGPDTTALQTRDSIQLKKNGKIITIASYAKRYQPRKALLYAAVLPGAGQIYNKKYWKVPLVYGGFAIITGVAMYYNNLYTTYKGMLYSLNNSGSTTTPEGYTKDQLTSAIDQARRERDFFVIMDGMWYLLQMVDAHVDAHLKEFDLNPQLKVTLSPTTQQNALTGSLTGFSLTLKF